MEYKRYEKIADEDIDRAERKQLYGKKPSKVLHWLTVEVDVAADSFSSSPNRPLDNMA